MKEERRVVMSVSNFRLIERLVYSATRGTKEKKPQGERGKEPRERIDCQKCGSYSTEHRHDTGPCSFSQKDLLLPLH